MAEVYMNAFSVIVDSAEKERHIPSSKRSIKTTDFSDVFLRDAEVSCLYEIDSGISIAVLSLEAQKFIFTRGLPKLKEQEFFSSIRDVLEDYDQFEQHLNFVLHRMKESRGNASDGIAEILASDLSREEASDLSREEWGNHPEQFSKESDSLLAAVGLLIMRESDNVFSFEPEKSCEFLEKFDSSGDILRYDPGEFVSLIGGDDLNLYVSTRQVGDLSEKATLLKFLALDPAHSPHLEDMKIRRNLGELADLNIDLCPYSMFIYACFSRAPHDMFLAWYRLVEGTYGYVRFNDFATELSVDRNWHELATMLDDTFGFRPKEIDALHDVCRSMDSGSASGLAVALCGLSIDGHKYGEFGDVSDSENRMKLAKCVYRLRNATVHYRPGRINEISIVQYSTVAAALAEFAVSNFKRAFGSHG